MSILLREIPLVILAGGDGRRMGMPKGLLRIGQQPILSYLLARMAWPGPKFLITAPGREHPPGCEAFVREWVDPVAGLGPLRGVLTASESSDAPLLVFATVDMPGIRGEHLAWAAAQLEQSAGRLGVMCRRGDGQIEPFPLALRREARPLISERLERGSRSVHRLLDDPRFAALSVPGEWEPEVWINLNEPGDLEQFVESLAKRE